MAFVNATVILFKCDKACKSFGVRVEEDSDKDWVRTWAFPVDSNTEKNENYSKQQVIGNLYYTSEYCGCPYCQTNRFVKCNTCDKITCFGDDRNGVFKCGWCGISGKVVDTTDKFDVSGNSF